MNCKKPIECFSEYNEKIIYTSTSKQNKLNFPSCGGHVTDCENNKSQCPQKNTINFIRPGLFYNDIGLVKKSEGKQGDQKNRKPIYGICDAKPEDCCYKINDNKLFCTLSNAKPEIAVIQSMIIIPSVL